MIEPTDEMIEAYQEASWDKPVGSHGAEFPNVRDGLVAVLAIVERDRATAGHDYLSTGCLHGEHDYCSSMTGLSGSKRPAQCKFCAAQCRCDCHGGKP